MEDGNDALQRRMDAIEERMTVNRADIDALEARAEENEVKAESAQGRITKLEANNVVERSIIHQLQADKVLGTSREHVAQMQEALRSSRRIGAALGIIMNDQKLTEEDAFKTISDVSQRTNVKVRDVAEYLVETGDVEGVLKTKGRRR